MFGIIYGLVNLGGRIIGNIQDNIIDNEHKRNMYDPKTETYLDHNYSQRDLKTNQLRHEAIVNGDKCLMGYSNKGSYIVRNLDEERRKYELNSFKNSEKTVVQYNLDEHVKDNCKGVRFIDVFEPNKLFVIREFKENNKTIANVYMDIHTGFATRCTDGEIKRQNENARHIENKLNKLWKTDSVAYDREISEFKKIMVKRYYKIYRNSDGLHKVKYQNHLIVRRFNEQQDSIAEAFHNRDSDIYFGTPCGSEVNRRLNYEWKK